MRSLPRPESLLEGVALTFQMAPLPLLDTLQAMTVARALLVAVKLDVFEKLEAAPKSAEALAAETGAAVRMMEPLLNTVMGAGYLRQARGLYSPTRLARKWILSSSRASVKSSLLFALRQWDLLSQLEEVVRTGREVDFYDPMTSTEWERYQGAQRDNAKMLIPEILRTLPRLPRRARVLDLGGGHGLYSATLCEKYPDLQATVLDLPGAIAAVPPDTETFGGRLSFQAGDVLTEDLGAGRYDLVLAAQLLHHFDEPTNRGIVKRAARALKPGGTLAIQEFIKRTSPKGATQTDHVGDLFYALVSKRGTWRFADLDSWTSGAGLAPTKRTKLLTFPGMGLHLSKASPPGN